MQQARE
jgi:Ca2+-binding EF-hand superfamily protein